MRRADAPEHAPVFVVRKTVRGIPAEGVDVVSPHELVPELLGPNRGFPVPGGPQSQRAFPQRRHAPTRSA